MEHTPQRPGRVAVTPRTVFAVPVRVPVALSGVRKNLFTTTRGPNLIRRVSNGLYCCRVTVCGKQHAVSRETPSQTEARRRLPAKIAELRGLPPGAPRGQITWGAAARAYVARFAERVGTERSPRTLTHIRGCLNRIERLWPVASIGTLRLDAFRRKGCMPCLTVLGHVTRPYGTAARLLVYTGIRWGELLALTWDDYAPTAGTLRVTQSKRRILGRAPTHRTIPVLPQAAELLAAVPPELRHGPIIRPGSGFRSALGDACRDTGIAHLRVHDLRRVFSTYALEKGAPIPTVAAWLGHADGGALLLKTYARARPDHGLQIASGLRF